MIGSLSGKLMLGAALAVACALPALAAEVVTTPSGALAGVAQGDVAAFEGIRFARPPVGDLRWRAPEPAAPWTGVRPAKTLGPACPQHFSPMLLAAIGHEPVQSEDCLYMNIWAPKTATPASKLPVMVWIYGGGFMIGNAAWPTDAGANLARRGVVTVNFNYRLGRLGWFAHPELTKEGGATGTADYGLMDQIAALKWVRDNIASFGGDPSNVTIFGVSAGGMSVNLLMTSPAARGLFAKAITESGLGRIEGKPLATAEADGLAFARSVGATDVRDLRKLSVAQVLGPQNASVESGENAGPIVDGRLVPEDVDRAFAEGKEAPVPWIVGSNTFEASLFPNILADPDGKVFSTIPASFRPLLMSLFDPDKTGDKTVVAANIVTDKVFTEPARFLASRQAKLGMPVYRYVFGYVPEAERKGSQGAGHGSEVTFVLGNLAVRRNAVGPPSAFDLKVSSDLVGYWTNFAKTGDPNGPGLAPWPKDTDDDVLVIDAAGEHAASHLHKTRLDLLESRADVH